MSEYTQADSGDLIGPMGWGDPTEGEIASLKFERTDIAAAQDDMPVFWSERPREVPHPLVARIEEIHQKHDMSYSEGSIDLRLVTELVLGELYEWPAQLIGSCVASGGMRAWTLSALWQVLLGPEPEELLGRRRLGVDTVAPFAPYNYGDGRKRGGMRGGDGSYCSVHAESFIKAGVIDCNTPALNAIVGTREQDYPETQDTRLYRAFGDWKHLEDLRQYADWRLLEAVDVTDANKSVELLRACKPHMICSNWGFAPSGQMAGKWHIYKKSGSWAHNMTIVGVIVHNGRLYILVLNSWGANAHRNGGVFVIPIDLYAQWLPSASCIAIGDIDLPKSKPIIW